MRAIDILASALLLASSPEAARAEPVLAAAPPSPVDAPASVPGPPAGLSRIRASRARSAVTLDGRLDEPAWADAPVYDDFVQSFPSEGARPSERTELRVLYDDQNLYVGFVCHDSHPGEILRNLSRRDATGPSDVVGIGFDSALDRRTAYVFVVNAGGVLKDTLVYDDSSATDDWDAVWDARTEVGPEGWTAEMVIPLSVLRFERKAENEFGVFARRELPRTHEVIDSLLIPRSSRGLVSRFGRLTGLDGIEPRREIAFTPYAATRLALRPQFSDPAHASPRLADPSLDVGFDLRAAVTSALTLNAAVNPDFGQVEADQVQLNLSTFELFFPEKRAFFTQGLDLFQPVGSDQGDVPQQLFYSRRIGLRSPILGAAKLTGSIRPGLQLGVVDAFVAGAGAPEPGRPEDDPDRRFQLQTRQPLHLGPNDMLPLTAPPPMNYLVAVMRGEVSETATVGGTVTSAAPLTAPCSDWQARAATPPPSCAAHGGNVAGLDFTVRSADSSWAAFGQVDGSQVVGGPPAITLPDGTVVRPGDTGLGGYATAGKLGGEPWRFALSYAYQSPRLDLNALGYLRTQNQQRLSGEFAFTRPSGLGPLRSFTWRVRPNASFSTDGRGLATSRGVWSGVDVQLPSFDFVGCNGNVTDPRWDLREIQQSGLAQERPAGWGTECYFSTDGRRPVSGSLGAGVGRDFPLGPLSPQVGGGVGGGLALRLHPRAETLLNANWQHQSFAARWVENGGDGAPLFADLVAEVFSVTVRQQLVVTPRLTFQGYAQLFTAYGRYGPWWRGAPENGLVPASALSPTAPAADPNFHESALNLSAVVRWEYRLGSTLFLVYSHSAVESPWTGATAPLTLSPGSLGRGPATDVVMLKWAYWWNVG